MMSSKSVLSVSDSEGAIAADVVADEEKPSDSEGGLDSGVVLAVSTDGVVLAVSVGGVLVPVPSGSVVGGVLVEVSGVLVAPEVGGVEVAVSGVLVAVSGVLAPPPAGLVASPPCSVVVAVGGASGSGIGVTIMLKVDGVARLPAASTAVHVTGVVPSGNTAPDSGRQVAVPAPSMSSDVEGKV